MSGTILIAAGGTGGHLFPAEALTQELTARGWQVLFVTDVRGKGFAKDYAGVEVARIRAATFEGRNPLTLAWAMFNIVAGTVQALRLIGRASPSAVIGFGGYPSLPVMIAASLRAVPRGLHEQNSVLGRVNRLIARYMSVIAASFPQVRFIAERDAPRMRLVGNPVRPGIVAVAGQPFAAPRPDTRLKLAIFGGSQGARIMSDIVPEAVAMLPEALRLRLDIVQQCRPEDLERTRAAYGRSGAMAELSHFFTDVPERLRDAHLIVARSGASTCAELTAVGRPAILVPYPFATDNHQSWNAKALAQAGAAILVPQEEFTPERLAILLTQLLTAPERLSSMAAAAQSLGRPQAARDLADLVEGLAMGQKPASSRATLEVRP
ncbi:MAG: undecaprenyldiphospho-muramoylpentapeptide beta-N-acetylglucosaminyltransferase [Alphaproteobacteria bacterium]|nr:undecaprenyldiphospho-muramoylpentapeptide beta-N-acetylglucosaminyltransferase [Alphaproteobacteria bacterium]